LFELLVVLLIMSVGLGLFLGFNYRQQAAVEFKAQGHALVQLMRAARSTAIVRGKSNVCTYDPQDKAVHTSLGQRKHTLAPEVELSVNDSRLEEKAEIAVFYPDGAAEAAQIVLHSSKGDQSLAIRIDPLFGDIQMPDDQSKNI
ncbi:MAG: hypothetical protein R6V55_12130, partial [Desulfovermiculus sp.]